MALGVKSMHRKWIHTGTSLIMRVCLTSLFPNTTLRVFCLHISSPFKCIASLCTSFLGSLSWIPGEKKEEKKYCHWSFWEKIGSTLSKYFFWKIYRTKGYTLWKNFLQQVAYYSWATTEGYYLSLRRGIEEEEQEPISHRHQDLSQHSLTPQHGKRTRGDIIFLEITSVESIGLKASHL